MCYHDNGCGLVDRSESFEDAIDRPQRAVEHHVVGLVTPRSCAAGEIAGELLVDLTASQARPRAGVALDEIGLEMQRIDTERVADLGICR